MRMHACVCSVVSDSANPWTVAHRLLFLWKSPGKNTGVGCHALLQGILPTQGSNPCLLHWQADSLPVSYQGSPRLKILISGCVSPDLSPGLSETNPTESLTKTMGGFLLSPSSFYNCDRSPLSTAPVLWKDLRTNFMPNLCASSSLPI